MARGMRGWTRPPLPMRLQTVGTGGVGCRLARRRPIRRRARQWYGCGPARCESARRGTAGRWSTRYWTAGCGSSRCCTAGCGSRRRWFRGRRRRRFRHRLRHVRSLRWLHHLRLVSGGQRERLRPALGRPAAALGADGWYVVPLRLHPMVDLLTHGRERVRALRLSHGRLRVELPDLCCGCPRVHRSGLSSVGALSWHLVQQLEDRRYDERRLYVCRPGDANLARMVLSALGASNLGSRVEREPAEERARAASVVADGLVA
jgi:hypothetical protein